MVIDQTRAQNLCTLSQNGLVVAYGFYIPVVASDITDIPFSLLNPAMQLEAWETFRVVPSN